MFSCTFRYGIQAWKLQIGDMLLCYSFKSFSYQWQLIVSHWCLSDCKTSQISRTLLSILAYLINAIVWMVSAHPLISKSFSPFTNHLLIETRTPITIGITVIFMFHSFLSSRNLFFFLLLSISLLYLPEQQIQNIGKFSFLLIVTRSGRLVEIRWSVFISKSQRSLCVSFSRTDSGLGIYHLLIWSKFSHCYYFTPWEFFTSVLADDISLKFERHHISLILLANSQYSGWSQ